MTRIILICCFFLLAKMSSLAQSPKGFGVNTSYSFLPFNKIDAGLNYSVCPVKFNGNACFYGNLNFVYADWFNSSYKYGVSLDAGLTTFTVGPSFKLSTSLSFPDRIISNVQIGISCFHTLYVHYGYYFSGLLNDSEKSFISIGIKFNTVNFSFIQRQ